jgi:hypothetical protein
MPKPNNPTIAESRPSRDHIHIANRLLLLAAKASWSGLKLIVKTAIQIPRIFIRLNTRPENRPDTRPPSQH